MHTVLIVIHVLLAIALIGMVLVQRGAGATAGAAFGSGASSTVFGSRGASSFLTRTTAVLASGFFLISLTMAIIVSRGGTDEAAQDLGIMGNVQEQQQSLPTGGDGPPAASDQGAAGDVPPAATGAAAEDESPAEAGPAPAEDGGE